jgi:hypothetical protein
VKSAYFLIPGDPETRTGGYLYDRRIVAGLRELGWQIELRRLSAAFPLPDSADLQDADAVLAALPAAGAGRDRRAGAGSHAERRRRASGAVATDRAGCITRWRWKPGWTSPASNSFTPVNAKHCGRSGKSSSPVPAPRGPLADYAVIPERCAVVLPGTDPAPLAVGSSGGEVALLCAASLTLRKGHAVLFRGAGWTQATSMAVAVRG